MAASYADQLSERGGRLYLAGVRPEVRAQIDRTNRLDLSGPVTIFEATPARGESTLRAVAESRAWLVQSGAEGRYAVLDRGANGGESRLVGFGAIVERLDVRDLRFSHVDPRLQSLPSAVSIPVKRKNSSGVMPSSWLVAPALI
ncbi:MAG: hypothetical protein M0R03_02685 [Novosphingobium sp.]|nr:hypothetical protein [Novosphingobium sp.]